jgi:hypothetical protein
LPSSDSAQLERKRSIAALLNRLALHCPVRNLPASQAALLMEDTINDLMGFDPRQVADGCTAWRQGSSPFFPTSGQLIACINQNSAARILHPGGHARTVFRANSLEGPHPALKPWRQILAEKHVALPATESEKPPAPALKEELDDHGQLSPERRDELRILRERLFEPSAV